MTHIYRTYTLHPAEHTLDVRLRSTDNGKTWSVLSNQNFELASGPDPDKLLLDIVRPTCKTRYSFAAYQDQIGRLEVNVFSADNTPHTLPHTVYTYEVGYRPYGSEELLFTQRQSARFDSIGHALADALAKFSQLVNYNKNILVLTRHIRLDAEQEGYI